MCSGVPYRTGLAGAGVRVDYATSGRFFINYTDANGNTVVARHTVSADDANVADPASAVTILTQEQPYANHNGGHMSFGADGYLYLAMVTAVRRRPETARRIWARGPVRFGTDAVATANRAGR